MAKLFYIQVLFQKIEKTTVKCITFAQPEVIENSSKQSIEKIFKD
jgi:hypothetical protein